MFLAFQIVRTPCRARTHATQHYTQTFVTVVNVAAHRGSADDSADYSAWRTARKHRAAVISRGDSLANR